jgi:hypothetical protein
MPWDAAHVARYAAAGVDRCVFNLPSHDRDDTERSLDRLSGLLKPFLS